MAENFIRFGSFQLKLKQTPGKGCFTKAEPFDPDMVQELYEFVIENHYQNILKENNGNLINSYIPVFEEVTKRTAEMVALW